jgi:hypothetical protein
MNKLITNLELIAETISDNDLQVFVDNIKDIYKGTEHNYINKSWGHSFSRTKNYGTYLQFGYGFSDKQLVKVGDFLLMETESNQIGRFLILHIDYQKNPTDLFWAYMVCDSYKKL